MDALPLMVFGIRRLDRPERSIIRFSAAPHHTCAVLHAAWYGRSRGYHDSIASAARLNPG